MDVKWTDVDITRIGYDGEPPESAPVVLWIKVIPGSISGGDGVTVAQKCRRLLNSAASLMSRSRSTSQLSPNYIVQHSVT